MFKIVIVMLVSILADGCNIGNTNQLPLASIGGSVNAGAVATIPILATTNSSTMMVVNNNTDSNLKLINTTVKVNGLILNLEQKKQLIDVSSCSTLSPNNQCKVIITPPRQDGGFVINMQYTDDHGVIYNTAQLITYSSFVSQNNGLIYFKPNQLKFKPGKNSISIPIMLASKHQKLNPAINNFFRGATTKIYCPNQELNIGDMCTLIVNFSITENNMRFLDITDIPQVVLSATLDADSSTQLEQTHAIFLSVSSNNAGNLITNGVNAQITPILNPVITLFNNGTTAVTNIQFESITPLIIVPSGNTPCGATLNSGSSCTFTLYTDSSATTGATNILISYNNGLGATNSLSFNAYYTTNSPSPLLQESSNGWLVNTVTNSINYQGIYVVNNGNITLNNLQFGALGPTGMNYGGYGQTCVNGQSLAPSGGCIMLINYYPITATGLNTFNITATASYPDQSGTSISYLANLIMQYSANASSVNATYVVGGDYGALTKSSAGIGTWATFNQTPFINNSTAITRMVNNGNLQVLGNNLGTSGQDIYSSDRGMIWESDNYSVAGSVTGLTYDGTNGYLVISAGGTGYLFYANPISGSTTYWAHTSGSWFPNTGSTNPSGFYDFNGQYFVLVSQSTYIDYSTTPINSAFAAITGTITAGTYVGMIYDGTYIFAVSSNMVICAPSGSISSWACSSNRIYPSGTLTGIGNNGTTGSYVGIMSTTPWVIYTATYPYSQTWTAAASSPGIPLKWVTYGASGGYIAVSAGTPGTIWTSPTGNIWTQQTQGTANNPVNESYNFAYYDGNNYWAAGNNVLKVSQNGVNWSNAGIRDIGITYVNGNLVYLAVGTAGAIESSTDLNTWTPANNLSIKSQLNSVQCFNSNNCYIVGNNGSILFSNNGLATAWAIESANTLQNLTGIACGYTNCVIVGSNGTILTESIGSNIWSIDNSPTSQALNSVAFNNMFNTYVAVGNNGVILSSNDGINWTQRVAGLTTNNLTSVACAYSQIGCMAVGSAGTIVTSANGISWQSGATVTGVANSVAFYNGIWVVAGNGGLISTTVDVANPSALAWTSRSSGLTTGANLNLNTALGF